MRRDIIAEAISRFPQICERALASVTPLELSDAPQPSKTARRLPVPQEQQYAQLLGILRTAKRTAALVSPCVTGTGIQMLLTWRYFRRSALYRDKLSFNDAVTL